MAMYEWGSVFFILKNCYYCFQDNLKEIEMRSSMDLQYFVYYIRFNNILSWRIKSKHLFIIVQYTYIVPAKKKKYRADIW